VLPGFLGLVVSCDLQDVAMVIGMIEGNGMIDVRPTANVGPELPCVERPLPHGARPADHHNKLDLLWLCKE